MGDVFSQIIVSCLRVCKTKNTSTTEYKNTATTEYINGLG